LHQNLFSAENNHIFHYFSHCLTFQVSKFYLSILKFFSKWELLFLFLKEIGKILPVQVLHGSDSFSFLWRVLVIIVWLRAAYFGASPCDLSPCERIMYFFLL
jgi:hypothetical protein